MGLSGGCKGEDENPEIAVHSNIICIFVTAPLVAARKEDGDSKNYENRGLPIGVGICECLDIWADPSVAPSFTEVVKKCTP
jgi:hypothetical protein